MLLKAVRITIISIPLTLLAVSCSDTGWRVGYPISFGMATAPPPLPPLTESELKVLRMIGGKVLPDGNLAIGKVTLLRRSHELSFPAETCITNGDLEVLICTESGRAHESLLKTGVNPYNVQLGLLLLGGVNGARKASKKSSVTRGTLIDIFVKLPDGARFPIERWLRNKKTGKEKKRQGWVFVGSSFGGDKTCLAAKEGNVVNTWSFGNTILDNQASTGDTDDYFEAFTEHIPEDVDDVSVLMRLRR